MAIAPAKNPLNSFRSNLTVNDFKLAPLPRLGELVSSLGLMAGQAEFDATAEKWRQDVEREINARVAAKGEVSGNDLAVVQAQLASLTAQLKTDEQGSRTLLAKLTALTTLVNGLGKGAVTVKKTINTSVSIIGAVVVQLVAQEDITAFAVVLSTGYLAHSDDPSGSFGRVAGIALTDANAGFLVNVAESGLVTNPLWAWTAGDQLFLSGSGLATIPPGSGFVQSLGTAKDNQNVLAEFGPPILL